MDQKRQIGQLIFFLVFIFMGCGDEGIKQTGSPACDGFDSMQDSFGKIEAQIDYKVSSYENEERVKLLAQMVEKTNGRNLDYLLLYANECLNNGDTQKAIEAAERIMKVQPNYRTIDEESKMLHDFLGICYLRLAEQRNCIHNHNDESCIVPIREGGVHTDPEPSRQAIAKYQQILNKFPDDYKSKWLLNLAFMTVDQYPGSVPEQHLILLPSGRTEMTMPNIATKLGVDHNGLSGGVIADDFNNDNLIDILVSSWGMHGTIKYYENHGDEGFKDMTEESNLHKVRGGLNLKQADFNNDGHLDFIVLRGAWKPNKNWGIQPNSLVRNNGDGTFCDVTKDAGMYSERPTQSAEWIDYNNDGWLDLFVANETTSQSERPFPCEFYHNNGDGTFKEIAGSHGLDFTGYLKAVTSGDVNNDNWPDLYLSNLEGANLLLLNQFSSNAESPFKNIADQAGVELPYASFPAWFFDYNNDGLDDIYVSSFDKFAFRDQAGQFARDMLGKKVQTESNRLYKNTGKGNFEDVTNELFDQKAISTMGCNFGDIHNDGYQDFYLGTGAPDYNSVVPNRFFTNMNAESFEDHTFDLGLGHIQKGHAIAFSDFDNDGDLDIYAVMGGAYMGDKFPNALYENPGSQNTWLQLRLVGEQANRSAIGAKVMVVGTMENGEVKTFYQRISSGASFGGNPLFLHMGLGQMKDIKSLEINWPDGNNEYVDAGEVSLNKAYLVTQGKTAIEQQIPGITFEKKEREHHHHHSDM